MHVMKFFVKDNILTADNDLFFWIPELVNVRTTVDDKDAFLGVIVQFLLEFLRSVYISSSSKNT